MERRTPIFRAPPEARFAAVALATVTFVAPAVCAGEPGASQAAPDFALKATDGRNLRLSEYRGAPVVLTFWDSRCGTCRETLVALDEVRARTSAAMLGVSLDNAAERAASVAASLALQFPTLVDARQAVARAYDVAELPLTLLIDRDGAVRGRWSGIPADSNELEGRLEALAKE